MVHKSTKSEMANTKKTENPLAQANCTGTQSSHQQELVLALSHLSRIPFDHVILVDRQGFAANVISMSFENTKTQLSVWHDNCRCLQTKHVPMKIGGESF